MICNQWDVVVVPFPFLDIPQEKRRPVLVISSSQFQKENQSFIGAMITAAGKSEWQGDTYIHDLESAGLRKNCFIRFKLFTLPLDIQPRRIGTLSERDRKAFIKNWKSNIPISY
ncbi:type II toxin-antitoxin system PemK/MazF family toxin [Ekhidna sp.]|uniref:type II toxin-antitoxin system PemK/MazF family toxin n=1 Tax=Ekhidna sp. TaxID=2608089 RepID=UPI003CCBE386